MSRDGVLTLIARLHGHAELVSAAYHHGEIVKNGQNDRGIETLQQHKVLIPRTQDTYTLHTTLRRFFDASLNIERLYRIGSDIGAAFEQLEQLAEALFNAAHEGRLEDRERLEDEFHQSVYEISDNLSADLAHLRALVENRFAAVTTLAEKHRQNVYYIGRTEKLVQAIEAFSLSDLGDRIQAQAPFANVAAMFHAQLLERLPPFRQNLLDILSIMQTYLFEFRSIEARTRRVRSMALFLERHPLYELVAWDEKPHPPAWLHKTSGIPVKATPAVREPAYTDDLAALAQEIAPPKLRIAVTRARGTLVLEEDVTVDLMPKHYQRAVAALLNACRTDGLTRSALAWYQANPHEMGSMTAALWIQCMLEERYRPKVRNLGLSIEVNEAPDALFDGNVWVRDVRVHSANEAAHG